MCGHKLGSYVAMIERKLPSILFEPTLHLHSYKDSISLSRYTFYVQYRRVDIVSIYWIDRLNFTRPESLLRWRVEFQPGNSYCKQFSSTEFKSSFIRPNDCIEYLNCLIIKFMYFIIDVYRRGRDLGGRTARQKAVRYWLESNQQSWIC